jgi:hypothetical protein
MTLPHHDSPGGQAARFGQRHAGAWPRMFGGGTVARRPMGRVVVPCNPRALLNHLVASPKSPLSGAFWCGSGRWLDICRLFTGSVGACVAQVDRVLGSGQALYAASAGPVGVASVEPTLLPAPANSELNRGVASAGDRYGQHRRGITALDADNNGTAGNGRAERLRDSAASTGVSDTTRSQLPRTK